jgi:protein arginine kinase activator
MLCEKCKKNEATAYIKTNVNGDVHEYHLCPECAAEMQNSGAFGSMFNFDSMFNPMSGFDLVSSLLSSPFGGFGSMPSISSGKRCSCCGSDFSSIAKTGKAGCPKCYTEFRAKLAPTIRKIHGNTVHCGKHSKVTVEQSNESQVELLKKQLTEAVNSENYELAAELRDKIKAMEK